MPYRPLADAVLLLHVLVVVFVVGGLLAVLAGNRLGWRWVNGVWFRRAHVAAIGIVLGLGASLALTRVVSTYLVGVSATDPVTFAGVPLVLLGVSALASYLPARRAMTIDPVRALREE